MAASLPDWFDVDFVRTTVTVLVVLSIVAVIVILITVRDLTRKLVAIGIVAAVAVGLMWYRAELDECEKTCTCKFIFDTLDCEIQ